MTTAWKFYGRRNELAQLQGILQRRRWFFLQISGRRRIGKTTLIQQALAGAGISKTLYIQIPDSDPAGVIAACNGYLETFGFPDRIGSLGEFAKLIGRLAESGYVVALDEFQYFLRKQLSDFCSLLQAEVDRLSARAALVPGGLVVLGSLHTEMTALLEDHSAPLFNRTTDRLELGHLDIGSVLEILRTHTDADPLRLLFLWNIFEGVPKFYRDAYEQHVLQADRAEFLERMFFSSSSPLRGEADNWFLRELRGRYDMVLQFLARHPGCSHADIKAAAAQVSGPGEVKQVGGYLKILADRYRMIERRSPMLAPANARNGRYYIRDNFLRAWLSALQRPVSAVAFRPLPGLIQQADQRLKDVEGHALEDLARRVYEERSRLGIGDFPVTQRIQGFWDRGDADIDLVLVNADEQRIRFASCKRDAAKLAASIGSLKSATDMFVSMHHKYATWRQEWAAIAPTIPANVRKTLAALGVRPQGIDELTADL